MNCPRLACLILALSFATTGYAHQFIYFGDMSGPAESPPNGSLGTGKGIITVDLDLVTMRVEANFSGLSGNVTAAHIHGPTPEPLAKTAGVATQLPSFPGFPTGVKAGVYDQTFDLTLASSYNAGFISANGGTVSGALNGLVAALNASKAYLNIHSSVFGGGEIRGFMVIAEEGDANLDRLVDGGDYTVWADNYLESGGWRTGDFNHDHFVDGGDYTLWADHYDPAALASAVPEPSSLTLAACGLGALFWGARVVPACRARHVTPFSTPDGKFCHAPGRLG